MPRKKLTMQRTEVPLKGRPQEWWTPARRAAHSERVRKGLRDAGVVKEKMEELERILGGDY